MAGKVEFANFVCKFGDKNLLDYAEEIVIPTFADQAERKYGSTRFVLNDIQKIYLEDSKTGLIVGRIIKDTLLKREQVYLDDAGLVEDYSEMQSSPSGIFLLSLNNHKLAYFAETSYAPKIDELKNTLKKLINSSWSMYTERVYHSLINVGHKKSRKYIRNELVGLPYIDIVPLQDDEALVEFIKGLKRINSISFSIFRRNDEFDGNGFFDDLAFEHENLSSDKTQLKFTSSGKESAGLSKNKVSEVVAAPIRNGHITFKLHGVESNGLEVIRESEQVKKKSFYDKSSDDIKTIGLELFSIMKNIIPRLDFSKDGERLERLFKKKTN